MLLLIGRCLSAANTYIHCIVHATGSSKLLIGITVVVYHIVNSLHLYCTVISLLLKAAVMIAILVIAVMAHTLKGTQQQHDTWHSLRS
jgi:hypothetical protein